MAKDFHHHAVGAPGPVALCAERAALDRLIRDTLSTPPRQLALAYRASDVTGRRCMTESDLEEAQAAADTLCDLAADLADECRDAIAYVRSL